MFSTHIYLVHRVLQSIPYQSEALVLQRACSTHWRTGTQHTAVQTTFVFQCYEMLTFLIHNQLKQFVLALLSCKCRFHC